MNLEDALGKLLSQPDTVEQVKKLAEALAPQKQEEAQSPVLEQLTELLPKGVLSLGQLPGLKAENAALLEAIRPYLSPQRQEKLTRALQIGRLSSLLSKRT